MADHEKRRLRLMNEVLPEPPPSGVGSPRQRTLANMQRLLALAAAGAALGAGRTRPTETPTGEQPAARVPPPAAPSAPPSATATPTAVATTTTPPTATPTASVIAPPSASAPPPPPPHATAPPPV